MRISDWSSDVCSSDLNVLAAVALPVAHAALVVAGIPGDVVERLLFGDAPAALADDDGDLALVVELLRLAGREHRLLVRRLRIGEAGEDGRVLGLRMAAFQPVRLVVQADAEDFLRVGNRSEEHTSELQSLMRISYAVFCLKH